MVEKLVELKKIILRDFSCYLKSGLAQEKVLLLSIKLHKDYLLLNLI